MNKSKPYDAVFIGNYTKDTIVSPSGVKYVDGGAINYAAHAAACLGVRSAVVTHLSKEDQRVIDKFEAAGIDCYVTYTPSSTLMKLEYPTLNPDIRTLSVAHTAGSISPEEVENLVARLAVIGSSLRGEVGLDVIQALHKKNMLLAADMQGFVRVLKGQELVYEAWDEMQVALPYLDILKSDAVEAEHLTGEKDIYKAARAFADMGAKEIVLTHKDGLLVYADGNEYESGFYPENLSGRSGRGDTCLGTYAAMRLSKPPAVAGTWAAAVTSLKMEKLGPFQGSVEQVVDFIHKKYQA